MKRVIYIALLMLFSVVNAHPSYVNYNHEFGIKMSNLVGYGAFYGYRVTETFKVQVTGVYYMYHSEKDTKERDLDGYTMGFELQKDVHQKSSFRIYLMCGGYFYYDDDYERNEEDEGEEFETHVIKNSLNCGVGLGLEYFFGRVTVSGEVGYKYFYDTGTKFENEDVEDFGIHDWHKYLEEETKIGAGINVGFIF